MKIDETISELQARLTANNRKRAKIILFAASGYVLLLAALLSMFSGWGSAAALATGLAVAILLVQRLNLWRPVSSLECSLILDRFFQSKERAVSYFNLKDASDQGAAQNKRELLEQQLNRLIDPSKIGEIARFRWARGLKITAYTGALAWMAAFAIFVICSGFKEKLSYQTKEAQMLAELLEKEPELPKPLKEDLRELALKIEALGLSAVEVKEALAEAQEELSKSQSQLAKEAKMLDESSAEQRQRQLEKPEEKQTAPTPPFPEKPSPPPSPEEQEQRQSAKPDTQSSSQASSQQSAKDKKAPTQATKLGAKQTGQGQEEKGSEGSGQGSGQTETGQPKEGTSGGREGEQGQSGVAQDKRKQDKGPASNKEAQTKEAGEAKEKEDGQGVQKDDSAKNKALDKKAAGLQKVEEALAQIEQEMQTASQNQESPGQDKQSAERRGEKPQDAGSKNESLGQQGQDKKPGQQEQSGQEQGADSKSKQTQEKDKNESASSKKNTSKGANQAQEKAVADKKSDKDATGASLPPDPNAPMRPISEDQLGQEGPGVGPNKQFKEAEIKANQEKFDTRFTGQDGDLARNEKEAHVKTDLANIKLAKPEASKDKAKQPIPLEYRDLIK